MLKKFLVVHAGKVIVLILLPAILRDYIIIISRMTFELKHKLKLALVRICGHQFKCQIITRLRPGTAWDGTHNKYYNPNPANSLSIISMSCVTGEGLHFSAFDYNIIIPICKHYYRYYIHYVSITSALHI